LLVPLLLHNGSWHIEQHGACEAVLVPLAVVHSTAVAVVAAAAAVVVVAVAADYYDYLELLETWRCVQKN